jgi:phosphoribosylaminoimidazole-succinocarboxamide synthase
MTATNREPDYRGKVRDVYDNGDGTLLFVASDRLSVFDVVLNETVPDKGRVLTALTHFWLTEVLADVAPSHLVSIVEDGEFAGRGMVVRKAEMLPVECIVRGYISGSAWKEYRASGTMHGQELPAGLQQSQQLPEPVFTPSTKAAIGDHDENISYERSVELVGDDVAAEARRISLEAYRVGSEWAAARGITIADTKFELGFIDGRLALCDEILTPDSSRFWPSDGWTPGEVPPSLDKQPVRDFLDATDWEKTPPPPPLPAEVIEATTARYREAYQRITGRSLDEWPGA